MATNKNFKIKNGLIVDGTISSGAITSSGTVNAQILSASSEIFLGASSLGKISQSGNNWIFNTWANSQYNERLRITDNGITVSGSVNVPEIETSGSFTLDVGGNITLNADGSYVMFNDDTINFAQFYQNASGNLNIQAPTQDKDIIFKGNDGGSTITALTLDMSVGGQLKAAPLGLSNPTYAFSNDSNTGMTRPTGDTLQFVTGGVERVRVDSSGNVLVGTTSTNPQSSSSVEGVQIAPDHIGIGRSGNTTLYLNRQTNDGSIISLRKAGSEIGSISTVAGYLGLASGDTGLLFRAPYDDILPYSSTTNSAIDNTIDLGDPSFRYKDLYLSGKAQADTYQFAQNSSAVGVTDAIYRATTSTIAFKTGSSERMRLNTTGLGIGTNSPSTALTIVGDITVSKTTAGSNILSLQRNGATNPWKLAQGHSATDYFEILEGNNARLTIKNGGNVGIGTQNPANLLSIESTGQFAGMNIKSASSNGISYIDFGDADDNNIGGINYDNSTNLLQFRNGNTNHAFLTTAGRFGLATGNPQEKLHVAGTIRGDDAYKLGSTTVIDSSRNLTNINSMYVAGYIYHTGDTDTNIVFSDDTVTINAGGQGFTFKGNGRCGIGTVSPTEKLHVEGNIELINNGYIGSLDGNYWQRIRFEDDTPSSTNAFNFETRNGSGSFINHMTITNNGDVGIKNSNPTATLTVGTLTSGQTGNVVINNEGGNTATLEVLSRTNRSVLKIADNDTIGYMSAEGGILSIGRSSGLSANNINIDSSNNVGIQTTSPSYPLEVNGNISINKSTANTGLRIITGSSYESYLIFGDSSDNSMGWVIYNNSTDALSFGSNNLERARIDSSGNFLIGKTSSSTGVAGARFSANGFANVTRDNAECINFNRLTSDGTIIDFRKDSTTIGNIGTQGGEICINQGGVGIRLRETAQTLIPINANRTNLNNTLDLGSSSARFKGLYLGNSIDLNTGSGSTNAILFFNNSVKNGWIGIPAWDNQSLRAYAPSPVSGNTNEPAFKYGSGAWSFWTDYNNTSGNGSTSTALFISTGGSVNIGRGDLQMNGTTVISSSRNLSNIGEITTSGNVNIGGTGNANIRVRHIEGKDSSSANYGPLFLNYSSTSNVQIGHSGNLNDLYIYGSLRTGGTARIDNSGNLNNINNVTQVNGDYIYNGGGNFDIKHSTASQNITFYTTPSGGSATERMRIKHDGNVGINTPTPAEKLTVSGNQNITGKLAVGIANAHGSFDFYNQNTAYFNGAVTIDANLSISGGGSIHSTGDISTDGDLQVDTNAQIDGILNIGSTTSVYEGAGGDAFFKNTNSGADLFLDSGRRIRFTANGSERARIDSSGNFLVGKTSTGSGTAGIELTHNDIIIGTRNADVCQYLNRLTSDGSIIGFQKDGTTKGNIGILSSAASSTIYLASGATSSSGTGLKFVSAAFTDNILPCRGDGSSVDNVIDLGSSSTRFDDIYATNGTIQTSDRNLKQDIQELSDAEKRVATACKGLLRRYKYNSAVAEKGDDARYHFGIIAQDLQNAFVNEGLDAGDYGMFISETWTDSEGQEQTRLGVRYNELLTFIIATL